MQIAAHRLSWALQNGTAYFDNQINFKQLLRKLKKSLCKLLHCKEPKMWREEGECWLIRNLEPIWINLSSGK